MPKVPSQLDLPNAPEPSTGFGRWATSLLTGLQRQWTNLTYVVNALSQVGTEAERPSAPLQDHIFYTASDTQQTYVAVGGAWASLGEQRDGRRYALLVG